MAVTYWIGGTTAQALIRDYTPATVEINDIFTVTVKDESNTTIATVNFTATVATVANVTAGLLTAWNAHAVASLLPITPANNTTKFTLTAQTAGVPFFVTSSTTDGGGANTQTLTASTYQANKGPNDFNTTTNWSGLAVPTTEDVTFDSRGGANAILYGLYQAGSTLASISHYFGAPQIGTTTFALQISATIGKSFMPAPDGSNPAGNLFNIALGANQTTWSNYGSGNTAANGIAPFTLSNTHASTIFNQYGGTAGIGLLTPGEANTVPTINARGGALTIGSGVTWTTITNNGAKLNIGQVASGRTLTNIAGDAVVNGTAKLGTLTTNGGNVKYNSRLSGDDIGIWNWDGGSVDFSSDAATIQVTTHNIKRGGAMTLFSPTQFSATTTTLDATYGTSVSVKVAG